MKKLLLDGAWELYYFPEGTHVISEPVELASLQIDHIQATVPGNVEFDLQRAGKIPDPFFASNIKKLRAFEGYEWWYTRQIDFPATAAGSQWELVFEGLDTLATVWINDRCLGQSDNMLIPHHFSASDALRPGQVNTITVRLGSVLNQARKYDYDSAMMSWEHRDEGLFIRKAPHVWGWDIMPRAVSAGIWRSVHLEEVLPNAFEQVYYWTRDINPQGATLGVRFQFRTDRTSL
jgi:beta-mannosidase